MTLGFMTQFPKTHRHLANQQTFFPEKILLCIEREKLVEPPFNAEVQIYSYYQKYSEKLFGHTFEYDKDLLSKKHTIRTDVYDRWKAGNMIHPVVGNQTKHRYQFAPTIMCTSVQKVEIEYYLACGYYPNLIVDGRVLSNEEMEQFAYNDGFTSMKDFCAWFSQDFKGTLIHWTNLKY